VSDILTPEREQLELALRQIFDPDDALSAAQMVVSLGWLPPGEVAASHEALRAAIREYLRENGMSLSGGPLLIHPRYERLAAALSAAPPEEPTA